MTSEQDTQHIPRGNLHGDLWIKSVASYYSAAQVVQWLSHINYETTFTEQEISSGHFPANLHNLSTLVRLQLLTYPFENTAMHYTPDHYMDVSPEGTFRRLVEEHKGSYCFGQSTLFLGMLRGLGYRAYPGLARVNLHAPNSNTVAYTPLLHMILFVQPIADSNETYLVDVGFGITNITQPILLSNADTNIVWGAVPPERHRLTRGSDPSSSLETFKSSNTNPDVHWQLEITYDVENPTWSVLYAFTEDEFGLVDCANASLSVSMVSMQTIFWDDVIILKYFLLSDEEIETAGKSYSVEMLDGTVGRDTKIYRGRGTWLGRYVMAKGRAKRQVGTRSEKIIEFKDEIERIRALREIFGIDVDDSAAKYIEGRAAALFPRA